jgi:hypothetical protein
MIHETQCYLPALRPTREIMGVHLEGVHPNIPNRNGFVYGLIGAPGSGKTSMLLSFFKGRNGKSYYRGKFNNIYLITPESSFLSVVDHPFQSHDKVYHDLTPELLIEIYNEMLELKKAALEAGEPIEKSLLIIDDFANDLKDDAIITLQSYNLFPLVLRKMLTNVTVFQFRNNKEMQLLTEELLHIPKTKVIQLFEYVFDAEYNHLDIDIVGNHFYKNFNLLSID